jgi:hypothetical protein
LEAGARRDWRNGVLSCARFVLLAGPVALAFFSGGYFSGPRNWAGLAAWALVAVAAAFAPRPLPRSVPAMVTVAGLALLALWTLVSFQWSPVAGTAYGDGQRVLLYLGVLLSATCLLRGLAIRLVEPAVAAGTVVVIGYGLSARLLPSLLTFARSTSAQGRLEQPLTYWNAMGAVAAIGLVLAGHLAGDRTRPTVVRLVAVAVAGPLGLGLYISFSRGALFACVAGFLALIVLAPTLTALRGAVVAVGAAVLASLVGAPFPGITSLSGHQGARVAEGAATLVALVVIAAAAALIQRHLCRREAAGRLRDDRLPLPRHAGTVVVGLVVACFAIFLALGAKEKSGQQLPGGAARLASLQSNRYDYWRVAWRAFKAEPIHGVGGGGWAVYWLRYRPIDTGAQDAHSLYIQTAAELGVVGIAFLITFLTGVVMAARRAMARAPTLAAGPIAGFVVWATHAAVDWDWEMPAVTLLAILLLGGLLAVCETTAGLPRPATALR